MFDPKQFILCSSTIKGEIFLKLFKTFLRILFFSGLLFHKQNEEEVTVQWGILFSALSFFPHAGSHFNRLTNSDCWAATFFIPLQIWQKKWKPRGYAYNGPVTFDCLSNRACRYYDTTQNQGLLLWETHCLDNLSQYTTNLSCRIQRAK